MDIQTVTPTDLLGCLNVVEEKYAPDKLYCLGNLEVFFAGPRVSIVGTRSPTQQGIQRTLLAVSKLVEAGATIVSGLAEGIDTAAHRGTINAGGHTLAVIGTPLDRVYPKSNADLFAEIVSHHLAISQFAIGTKTGRHSFPMRNRTMALLSDATIIVEAGEKSGTERQGWEAIRLGRPLYFMESMLEAGLSWPEKLISYGAEVLTRDNFSSVIEDLAVRELDLAI